MIVLNFKRVCGQREYERDFCEKYRVWQNPTLNGKPYKCHIQREEGKKSIRDPFEEQTA